MFRTGKNAPVRYSCGWRKSPNPTGGLVIVTVPLHGALKEFAKQFEPWMETEYASKPATVRFYKEKLRRLLSDGVIEGT
jgi:hypothetical protein